MSDSLIPKYLQVTHLPVKLMKSKINSILQDLFTLDPSLKKDKKELERLIQTLLDAEPELEIDEQFVKKLRHELKIEREKISQNQNTLSFNFIDMMKKIFVPLGGGALVIIAAIAIILNVQQNSPENKSSLFATENQIIAMEPGAFGTLDDLNITGSGERNSSTFYQKAPNSIAASPAPQIATNSNLEIVPENNSNSDSVNTAGPSTPPNAGGGGINGPSTEGKIATDLVIDPGYIPTVYKYIYKGESIPLDQTTVDVYKRTNQKANSNQLANTLKGFGFNLMDLSPFENLEVELVNLAQNQKHGYSLSLNFMDSSLSVNQNWLQWDYPGSNCGDDQACYERSRIKASDIPSDEELLNTAQQFLNEHQVNMDNYGEPVIQKYWERDIVIAQQEGRPMTEIYYPDTINIVYPLLIEGEPTSDQWGNPLGLNVGVSVYAKRVSSVNGLRVNQFQKSAYEAITDWNMIANYLAEGASPYPIYFETTQVNTKEIEVGAPEKILISMWQYKNNESNEFYTPALKFPILQPSSEFIYQPYVIVPLAKELLSQNDGGRPMPLIKAAQDTPLSTPTSPPSEPRPEAPIIN